MRRAWLSLISKQLRDSRWLLIVSAFMLFMVGWSSVYVASVAEDDIRKLRAIAERIESDLGDGSISDADAEALKAAEPLLNRDRVNALANDGDARRLRWRLRDFQGATRASEVKAAPSVEYMIPFWQLIFILPVIAWGISRGSIAVAGEIERGTLDLVLSRPISRGSYLATQWASATLGFVTLTLALIGGSYLAMIRYPVAAPPGLPLMLKPALNLAALWLCVYGAAFALSCGDLARWRPTLIVTSFVLASAVAQALAQIPQLRDYKEWMENASIFTAYNPVDAAKGAEWLVRNVAVLGGIGFALLAAGWFAFRSRDLPSNS